MKKMIIRVILFLIITFGGLAIGGSFTSIGVASDWHATLVKAPWTPPGWVFGVAWSTIMICFSVYIAYLWGCAQNKPLLLALFVIQWILNVGWNPTFFYYHNSIAGLIIISLLTILVGFFLFFYLSQLRKKTLLILPYFFWLLVATSLNAYIVLYN